MSDIMLSMEEKTQALELVNGLSGKISEVISQVQQVQKKVDDGQLNTAKGISFLEVKHQLLLSYIINLTQLMLTKVSGKSIKGEATIERLIEVRTVLEKMRPIDQKLKYQIDKLIKAAATGSLDQNDPLRLKPNPDNLVSKLDGESGSDDEEGDETKASSSSRAYKPPKLAAVHYDEDESIQEKKDRLEEKKRKKMKSSAIMKDLRDQYSEGPEEITDNANLHRTKDDTAGKEREEYEMKYFVRMQLSKKDLAAQRKVRTMGSLNSITHFGDSGAYARDDDGEDGDTGPTKKKRKINMKGKKKANAKRFRRK